jgi:hypothetical protein
MIIQRLHSGVPNMETIELNNVDARSAADQEALALALDFFETIIRDVVVRNGCVANVEWKFI